MSKIQEGLPLQNALESGKVYGGGGRATLEIRRLQPVPKSQEGLPLQSAVESGKVCGGGGRAILEAGSRAAEMSDTPSHLPFYHDCRRRTAEVLNVYRK